MSYAVHSVTALLMSVTVPTEWITESEFIIFTNIVLADFKNKNILGEIKCIFLSFSSPRDVEKV